MLAKIIQRIIIYNKISFNYQVQQFNRIWYFQIIESVLIPVSVHYVMKNCYIPISFHPQPLYQHKISFNPHNFIDV